MLWNAVYRVADFTSTKRQQALLTLLENDWELFTETSAYASQGWPETARARQFAAYTRASISQAMYRQYLLAFADIDVSTVLARVSCPTLVFHRKEVAKFELVGVAEAGGVVVQRAAGAGRRRIDGAVRRGPAEHHRDDRGVPRRKRPRRSTRRSQ